jgi:hypothetical protein
MTTDSEAVKPVMLNLTKFTIEFAWKPTELDKRPEIKVEAPATEASATSTETPTAAPTPAAPSVAAPTPATPTPTPAAPQ